jgi:hypothetical protein
MGPAAAQRVVPLYGGVAKVTLGKDLAMTHEPKDNTYTVSFAGDPSGPSVHINREKPKRPGQIMTLGQVQTFFKGIEKYFRDNKSKYKFKEVNIRRRGRAITMSYQNSYREDGRRKVSKTLSKVLLPRRGGLIQADHSPERLWMWKGRKSRTMQQVVESLRL